MTRDTGILITKKWILPLPEDIGSDCNFLIQATEFRSADGQTHTGLNIGEAIDWDIPSDSASRNRSGFAAGYPYGSPNVIYQQGSEYDDDPQECQENSDRYGGIAFLEVIEVGVDDTICNDNPYGAYTGSNSLWVYPMGAYVPEELDSLMTAREGFVLSDSIDSDLHSVMTFKSGYTLTPDKTLIVFSCLVSGRLGYADFMASAATCRAWYRDWQPIMPAVCCLCERGNVDFDPQDAIDISDLIYLVDYMFTGGPPPQCEEEADVDASGSIDISDLVYLVDYMFSGGPPPADCPYGACPNCDGLWQILETGVPYCGKNSAVKSWKK